MFVPFRGPQTTVASMIFLNHLHQPNFYPLGGYIALMGNASARAIFLASNWLEHGQVRSV